MHSSPRYQASPCHWTRANMSARMGALGMPRIPPSCSLHCAFSMLGYRCYRSECILLLFCCVAIVLLGPTNIKLASKCVVKRNSWNRCEVTKTQLRAR